MAPKLDSVKVSHDLLTQARDDGADDATWEKIFTQLRKTPKAILKPAVRKFSLLHQAAYWGKAKAVNTLIVEFGADLFERTTDGEEKDSEDVASAEGYASLATVIKKLKIKAKAKVRAKPKPKVLGRAPPPSSSACESEEEVCEAEPSVADIDPSVADAAPSPYQTVQPDGNESLALGVPVWICLRLEGGEFKWTPYTPTQNEAIDAARAKGSETVTIGSKILNLTSLKEDGPEPSMLRVLRVLWEWDSGAGGKDVPEWKPYIKRDQWLLERAMCQADATCEVGEKDKKYLVDLVGFRQHSATDSFKTRRVRRRGAYLRAPFPAKVKHVSSGSWLDLSFWPSYWGAESASSKREELLPSSPQFVQIAEWINKCIRTGHAAAYGQVAGGKGPTRNMEVVRVEVVHQPALWRRYLSYREQLRLEVKEIQAHNGTKYLKKNPMAVPQCPWLDASVNEAYFWHGSGKNADGTVDLIDAIVSTGHTCSDESNAEMVVADGASSRFAKTSSMFGSGVYLADISSKANLYVPCPVCHGGAYFRHSCSCSKADVDKAVPYRMLLCRATLGRVYIEKAYKDSRYKGEFNPAKKLGADSVMGEVKPGQLAFREYIVYSDRASYPEFIVHYKRHAESHGCPPKKKGKFGV